MERIDRGEMMGDSDHSAVKTLRYEVLEHMGRWCSSWVAMQTEIMKIRESCSKLREELKELRSQYESTTCLELDKVDEEIHQNRLGLQGLFNKRARLRKERSKVEIEVKQVEEEIKRRLLGKKVVVIEQEELDYIDKLEAHYRELDLRKFSSKDLVDESFGNTFEQNAVEGKLGTKQADPRPSSPDKQDEAEYLKRKKPLKCWFCAGPHVVRNCPSKPKVVAAAQEEEVEAVHKCLKTQHQTDTWVDESKEGNFLAFLSS